MIPLTRADPLFPHASRPRTTHECHRMTPMLHKGLQNRSNQTVLVQTACAGDAVISYFPSL